MMIVIVIADPCYNYRNLSDADRKSTYNTPYGEEKCDDDSSSIIFESGLIRLAKRWSPHTGRW